MTLSKEANKVRMYIDETEYFMYFSDTTHIFHKTPSGKIHRIKRAANSDIFRAFYKALQLKINKGEQQ